MNQGAEQPQPFGASRTLQLQALQQRDFTAARQIYAADQRVTQMFPLRLAHGRAGQIDHQRAVAASVHARSTTTKAILIENRGRARHPEDEAVVPLEGEQFVEFIVVDGKGGLPGEHGAEGELLQAVPGQGEAGGVHQDSVLPVLPPADGHPVPAPEAPELVDLQGALGATLKDPKAKREVEAIFASMGFDVAGWSRSGAGWPDMGASPVTLMPDWVAEVLSPGTEATDRGVKTEAYGAMGVGSLWLVDCERQRIETFTNVRGRMVAGPVFGLAEAVVGDPFGPGTVPVAEILG